MVTNDTNGSDVKYVFSRCRSITVSRNSQESPKLHSWKFLRIPWKSLLIIRIARRFRITRKHITWMSPCEVFLFRAETACYRCFSFRLLTVRAYPACFVRHSCYHQLHRRRPRHEVCESWSWRRSTAIPCAVPTWESRCWTWTTPPDVLVWDGNMFSITVPRINQRSIRISRHVPHILRVRFRAWVGAGFALRGKWPGTYTDPVHVGLVDWDIVHPPFPFCKNSVGKRTGPVRSINEWNSIPMTGISVHRTGRFLLF